MSVCVVDDVLRIVYGGDGLGRNGSSGADVDSPEAGSWVANSNGNILFLFLEGFE